MPTRNHPGSSLSTAGTSRAASPAHIEAALGEYAQTPLRRLLARATRASYDPQDVLYHAGSESDTLYFITAGLLKLVTHLPSGRARIVRLHRPASILGLSGLRDRNNEHTAIALTPVTALRLPLGSVRHLRTADPATYASLLERWHDYLQDADTWITQFSTGPIRGRVARLVAFLSEFEPDAADGEVQLLTCEEMGSILGVTSESASRILAEFKRERILVSSATEANETYAADLDRLHDIGDEE
ncbi:MAG: Crp/Fnr family transcriptional regulator [Gammaproteobacteria bacterium]|jgi:CRP-like cAMP-binding protein